MLLLFAPPKAAAPTGAGGILWRLWESLGLAGRIAVVVLAVGLLLWLVGWGLRRLGKGGRRGLLWGFTGLNLAAAVGLAIWARTFPEPRGSSFILWHQVVRVGAALSGTGFVVGFLGLLLPWMLTRMEGVGFVNFVAVRHVRSSKSGFLTVISFLSIAGVGVSSFALCAVVSIMGGFGADLKRKILGNNAHIKIEATRVGGFDRWLGMLDDVRALHPRVQAATPIASGEAMASSSSNTAGVMVRGIDLDSIGNVIDLLQNIEVGRFEYLSDTQRLARLPPDEVIGLGPGGEAFLKGPDSRLLLGDTLDDVDPEVRDAVYGEDEYPGVILGRELARTLHVFVGDEVTLVSPLGELGPMGLLPRSQRFRVAAIFYSGMYEYDASHAYMRLDVAQQFLDLGDKITAIEVKVPNAEAVDDVSRELAARINREDVRVRDWKEVNRQLFSALKLEKIATFIILSIAIAVASFCIICTLLLMVTEKSKEIAILKAIGASDRAILRTFMTEGIIIGAIGTLFGVATGYAATRGLKAFGVRLDPDVYYVDRLPIHVDPTEYLLVAVAGLLITTAATIYPAIAASRLRPVDGIRYE
jgi:lipoprotein-releasing system permease protein